MDDSTNVMKKLNIQPGPAPIITVSGRLMWMTSVLLGRIPPAMYLRNLKLVKSEWLTQLCVRALATPGFRLHRPENTFGRA